MIELQHQRIGLPAVDAGMVAEVVDEKARVKVGQSALAQARKVDVPPRGSRVVFLLVVGAARTTAVVKLAFDATSPGKGPVTRILGREEPTSRARKVGEPSTT